MRFLVLLENVAQAIAILVGLINAVEAPGDGAEKKAIVITEMQKLMTTLPVNPIIKMVFTNDVILGVFVDLLVSNLKRLGWLTSAPAVTPATEDVPS